MKRIGIDFDGVLANFARGFTGVLATLFPEAGIILKDHTDCRHYDDWGEGVTAEMLESAWVAVNRDGSFWSTLPALCPPMEQGELLGLSLQYDLFALTTRPQNTGRSIVAQCRQWMKHHGLEHAGLAVCHDKWLVGAALGLTHYLDDAPEQISKLRWAVKNCQCYLMDQPYNRGVLPDVPRVKTVMDFIQQVNKE
jgi:hypothetical protein